MNQNQNFNPEVPNQIPSEVQAPRAEIVKKLTEEEITRIKEEQLKGMAAQEVGAAPIEAPAPVTSVTETPALPMEAQAVPISPSAKEMATGPVDPVEAVEKLDGILETGPAEYVNAVRGVQEKYLGENGIKEDQVA